MQVSIIVPVYNRENTIRNCIDSILNQGYDNLEVIVVDDGSTDSTLAILESYAEKIVLIRKANSSIEQGASYARNRGLQQANGDIIGFLDSDDYFLPNYLNSVLPEFNDLNIGYVFSKAKKQAEDGLTLSPWTRSKMMLLDKQYHVLYRAFNINTNVILIRKSVLDSVGLFDVELTNGEDTDLWIRISEVSIGKFSNVNAAVYRVDHSPNQLSKIDTLNKRKCAVLVTSKALQRYIISAKKDPLRLLLIIRALMYLARSNKSTLNNHLIIHLRLMILFPFTFFKFIAYAKFKR